MTMRFMDTITITLVLKYSYLVEVFLNKDPEIQEINEDRQRMGTK